MVNWFCPKVQGYLIGTGPCGLSFKLKLDIVGLVSVMNNVYMFMKLDHVGLISVMNYVYEA